jgi:chemotaxis protein methyltransferase CheR
MTPALAFAGDQDAALKERLLAALASRAGLAPRDGLRARLDDELARRPPAARQVWAAAALGAGPRDPAWLSLLEPMLVHETYFFRHVAQLALLERQLSAIAPAEVWCAACATGEEAWTVALLAPNAVVLASDLSPEAVATANTARYVGMSGLGPFRDIPARWATRLPIINGVWEPSAPLRRRVRFRPHNLATEPPPVRQADAVLCRNALLYLTREAAARAEQTMRQSLRPGGLLLLGPSERLVDPTGWEVVEAGGAVAFRRGGP